MNLRDKVGQRFMLSFEGTELSQFLRQWLLECRPGGLILFGRNIKNLEQLATLTSDLQDFAAKNGLPPFILAIDEEGGRVSRMPAEGQLWITPSQMAQAAAGPEFVRACAGVTARRLRQLGLNLNFAPVADINNNPANPVIGSRSFGSDPQQVAKMVAAAVEVYNAAGVGSCVKHFPGHGDTGVDSHHGLPVINYSRDRLDEIELVPFREAFAADVPALMTAHVLFPALEQDVPVTLSRKFLIEILRNELDFKGLVFTDALEMKAISERYTPVESTFATLRAGADMALPCFTMEIQRDTVRQLVTKAGANGFELENGLERVLAFKERFCRTLPAKPDLYTIDQEAQDANQILMAARHSTTLVSKREGFQFGGPASTPTIIDFALPVASPAEESRPSASLLRTLLVSEWPVLRYLKLNAHPTESEIALSLSLAQSADKLVVIVRNSSRIDAQAKALQLLVHENPETVVVAARDPYDLQGVTGAAACLATYGDPPCSIRALAEILLGKRKPSGKLPVTLEGL